MTLTLATLCVNPVAVAGGGAGGALPALLPLPVRPPAVARLLPPARLAARRGEGEEAMAEDMLISPKRSRDGELLGRQAASPVPMSVATPRAEEVLPAALMNPHNKPFAWGRGGGGAVSGGAAGSAAAGFPRPGSAGQARGGGDRFRARAGGSREGSPALRATPGHLPGGDGRQGTPQGGHRRGAADVEAGGRGSSGRDRGGRRSGGRGGAPPSLSTEKQLFNENN
ncbi:hypothetical protein T492DRAFT_495197 [Pavlovales sp. CCMP2436]|nr:hypothetical protein T492DRAFT_495197 [Pavlovales sp. CCMP2436]